MYRKLFLLTVILISVTVFARMPQKYQTRNVPITESQAPALQNLSDSVSYALGIAFANDVLRNSKMFPIAIDSAMLARGFTEGINGKAQIWTAETAGAYINERMSAAQKEKDKANIATQAAWLENNKTQPGVVTLPSGLQYKILEHGTGTKHPTATSNVKVHYEGSLIDGTVFDSSLRRGEPITFRLNQVIKGWTEGVQLMVTGDEYMLYLPYQLAYGENGAGGMIPPYATLIFKIKLLEISE